MNNKPYTTESFVTTWNEIFLEHKISVEDLKKPHALMAAVFQAFDHLGIDRDAVIAPPSEKDRNENVQTYWDLVPVINTTKVINHVVVMIPDLYMTNTITQLLQPCVATSYSMLLLLYNLIVFREKRMCDLEPSENELFSKSEEIEKLKNKKNCLIELLNKQTVEKAERAGRLKNIERESKQYEEEIKQENEAMKKDMQEFESKQKECRQMQIMLEQKKSTLDSLFAEVEKARALRVYDAEDIRARVECSVQNDQEVEQRLDKLRVTLMEKEDCLKNLQLTKPNLDTANNLLYEMTKMLDSLRSYESEEVGDELEELREELGALQAQAAEAGAARALSAQHCEHAARARRQRRADAHRSMQECEEKEKESAEKCEKATQRVLEIKDSIAQHEKQKMADINELKNIEKEFADMLEAINETVLMRVEQAKEKMIDCKMANRLE